MPPREHKHKHKPNKPNNPELSLLHPEDPSSSSSSSSLLGQASDHSLRTAPILSGDAASLLGPDLIPQRAVYGRILRQVIDGDEQGAPVQPQVYINSNAPFSAVVCGLQVRVWACVFLFCFVLFFVVFL